MAVRKSHANLHFIESPTQPRTSLLVSTTVLIALKVVSVNLTVSAAAKMPPETRQA